MADRQRRERHGRTRSNGGRPDPTYLSWRSMRGRCNNPNDTAFGRYGGRGIKVCQQWRTFSAFLADMGERPPGHQLDRIDNDSDYTPENCRWITKRENATNRSTTVHITIDGVTHCATDWAAIHGIPADTILGRIKRGWDPVQAVTQPRDMRYVK